MKEIVLLDLFSGIGGFSKGITEAGFKIKTHYFSEIDNHAIANYKYNFKNAKYCGSVTDVRGADIERPNIITFGSPCQDFSLAGKRAGMEGKRSSLIGEAIRLIIECRPDFFIWENVKGAFSSNNSEDFWGIIQAFANIGGYRLEWQLVNTSWLLPQNRERIYLIGHFAEPGRSFRPVFPIRESDFLHNESQTSGEEIHKNSLCLTAKGVSNNTGSFIKQVNDKKNFGGTSTKQQDRIYDVSGIMACLSSSRTESKVNIITQINPSKESNGKQPFQQNRIYDANGIVPTLCKDKSDLNIQVAHVSRTDEAKEIRKQNMKNGKDYTPFQAKKLEFKDSNIMNTITCATTKDNLIKTTNIRRLTEIECERLQGFPDNWTKFGDYNGTIKEVPKTQRYKMCGNSVTVAIVKMIAERLK
jgi:DNA (cytosine-5)-methyltransferase 1